MQSTSVRTQEEIAPSLPPSLLNYPETEEMADIDKLRPSFSLGPEINGTHPFPSPSWPPTNRAGTLLHTV